MIKRKELQKKIISSRNGSFHDHEPAPGNRTGGCYKWRAGRWHL